MSSDDFKPRPEPGFRPAGVGLAYTMRCGKCSQPMRNFGRRQQRVRGVLVYVGKCCQKAEAAA